MRYKVIIYETRVEYMLDIFLPPTNPIGLYFEFAEIKYKIIDAIFRAKGPDSKLFEKDSIMATLTITAIN